MLTLILIILSWLSIGLGGYGLGWLDGRHDLRKEYASIGRSALRHEKHEVKK